MPVALSIGVEIAGDGIGRRPDGSGIADLARRLESAGVHYWVLGTDRAARPSLDPSLVATVAARHSSDLGLVIAAAAHRDHPYNLARRLLSVDHAAGGRVGWFALDTDHRIDLDADVDTWTGAGLDPDHTAAAITAVRTLWRTWPLTSLVGDRETGVFADTTQIRRADVDGTYSITGPLNVPGSRQGDLPIWQRSGPGTRDADVVVIEDGAPVPGTAAAVLRVDSADPAVLDRAAHTPGLAGVLIRLTPDTLAAALDDVLPSARRQGLAAAGAEGTLRHRLGLPVPADPDLSTHRRAFDDAPSPGVRQ